VLARHPDGGLYLIWRNRRHPVADDPNVLAALTRGSQRPVPVSPALLNNLELGSPLGFLDIPGRGQPSQVRSDARIGQLYVVRFQGGGQQYWVALRQGVAPVTPLQADLLLSDPRTRQVTGKDDVTELRQAEFAAMRKEPALGTTGAAAPPETRPELAAADTGALCAVVPDDHGVAAIRVGAAVPEVADAARTGSRSGDGAVLADYVVVEPGRGAVVEAAAAPGAPGGALSVVTNLGRRYPVAGREVLGMLGYGRAKPSPMPAGLVSLIPSGRALDPQAALAPAVPG
jgi:type VII secretion protein EccB